MKIYMATGFSIMNLKGREQEICDRFKMKRLFSFGDIQNNYSRVTRCLEVYSGHIYSKKEGVSEL